MESWTGEKEVRGFDGEETPDGRDTFRRGGLVSSVFRLVTGVRGEGQTGFRSISSSEDLRRRNYSEFMWDRVQGRTRSIRSGTFDLPEEVRLKKGPLPSPEVNGHDSNSVLLSTWVTPPPSSEP